MNRSWSWRELLLAAVAALAGAALLLAEPLFGGRSTLAFDFDDPRVDLRPWSRGNPADQPPLNLITPDATGFHLPGVIRAHQLEADGSGLLWDGSQLIGYPFAANLPCPVYSPVTWVLQGWVPGIPAADPVTMVDLALWFHIAAGLLLAYRACRMLGVDPPFAALGAVGFALCSWMYVYWHAAHSLYTMVWWPGQVAALERFRRGHLLRGVAEGGFFTGMMFIAGFPQLAATLTGGVVLLVLIDGALRKFRTLACLGAAILLGALLAAPQLLLSYQSFKQSIRSSPETRTAAAKRDLPPASLIGIVFPEFFGRPTDFSLPERPAQTMEEWMPQRLWWSHDIRNNPIDNTLYPGIVVILLASLVVHRGVDGRAKRLLACAMLALFAAVAMPAITSAIPGVSHFAVGSLKRITVIFALFLPLAATMALQALGDRKSPVPWITAIGLIVAVILTPIAIATIDDPQAELFSNQLWYQAFRQGLFIAAGLISLVLVSKSRYLRWIPVIVLAADLVLLARGFNPFPEQTPPYPETVSIERLRQREGRIAVFGTGINTLLPTAAGIHGIRSLHGVAPMVPGRAVELLGCIEGPLVDMRDPRIVRPFENVESLTHPILDLLGVDTVVHTDPTLSERSGLPTLFEIPKDGLGALDRPTADPLVFLCGGARRVNSKEERLTLLSRRDFPFKETLLIERSPEISIPETGECVPVPYEKISDSFYRVDVDAPFAGILVLAENHDTGWKVNVDGKRCESHIVHHALMGVELSSGRHEVVFEYNVEKLIYTQVAAVCSLGAIIILLMLTFRTKQQ